MYGLCRHQASLTGRPLVWHCTLYNTVELIMGSLKTIDQNLHSRTRDINFFSSCSFSLSKPEHLQYPQCNLDTKCHRLRLSVRLHAASSGATKGFVLLFHICGSTSQTHFNVQNCWSYPLTSISVVASEFNWIYDRYYICYIHMSLRGNWQCL